MWPFKSKPTIDADTVDWQFECFEWLLREYGADLPITTRQLVLPKPGFFITDGEKDHALAQRLFDTVKAYAGLTDWPVQLTADAPVPEYEAGTFAPQPMRHAAGTFSVGSDKTVEITYQPKLLQEPQQLIATFAHELAHFVLSTATTKPPCDEDELEFLTDLTAVYLGFGVFLSNNVLNFKPIHDLGGGGTAWSYVRTGYLPENDLVHATAIFLKLSGENQDDAANYLKSGLGRTLRKCLAELKDKTEALEKLADSPPPSPYQSESAAAPQLQQKPTVPTVFKPISTQIAAGAYTNTSTPWSVINIATSQKPPK